MTKIPTRSEYDQWARDNKHLALEVCAAMATAQVTRQAVDEYVKPIFDSFNFQYSQKLAHQAGPIPTPSELYLCEDDARLTEYYAACTEEHRRRGFRSDEVGDCPASAAEWHLIQIENRLIESARALAGIENYQLTSEQRRQYLDLLLVSILPYQGTHELLRACMQGSKTTVLGVDVANGTLTYRVREERAMRED